MCPYDTDSLTDRRANKGKSKSPPKWVHKNADDAMV